jgi:hypothetical protein
MLCVRALHPLLPHLSCACVRFGLIGNLGPALADARQRRHWALLFRLEHLSPAVALRLMQGRGSRHVVVHASIVRRWSGRRLQVLTSTSGHH